MCGHMMVYYQDRDRCQQHRPVWQCSTCGRVSSMPLDCCARPDYALPSSPALTQLLGRWLEGLRDVVQATYRVLPFWPPRAIKDTDVLLHQERSKRPVLPEAAVTARPDRDEPDRDEMIEREDTPVGAGVDR